MGAATATALVVENKLEPVNAAPVVQQLVVTGQGLFDLFMVESDSDKTRMGFIRSMVDLADDLQLKGACDNMVERARKIDYPTEKPKGAPRGSKEQQAMNVRTTVLQAWGALKFARGFLDLEGYSEETGYNAMRVLAPRALKSAAVAWNGIALPSDADRERSALLRQQKAQTTAMLEATKDTPRELNESFASWQARVAQVAESRVEEARAEDVVNAATAEFKKLTKKHPRAVLATLAHLLLEHLKEENAGQSELTEEEANAMLAAEQAGDIEIEPETVE